jgi:hypothetical protein
MNRPARRQWIGPGNAERLAELRIDISSGGILLISPPCIRGEKEGGREAAFFAPTFGGISEETYP